MLEWFPGTTPSTLGTTPSALGTTPSTLGTTPSTLHPYIIWAPPDVSRTPTNLSRTVVPRPTSVVPRPTSVVPRPTSVVPRPTSVVPQPTSVVPRPTSVVPSYPDRRQLYRRTPTDDCRTPADVCLGGPAITAAALFLHPAVGIPVPGPRLGTRPPLIVLWGRGQTASPVRRALQTGPPQSFGRGRVLWGTLAAAVPVNFVHSLSW